MRKFVIVLVIIVAALIGFIALGPYYILEEGKQALVFRFGAVVNSADSAGIHFKTPMVDTIQIFDKKILTWDGKPKNVTTKDNEQIFINTTARWKIVDLKKFYNELKSLEGAYRNLDQIIESSIQTVISKNKLIEVVRNSNTIQTIGVDDIEILNEIDTAEESSKIDIEKITRLTSSKKEYETISKGRTVLAQEMFEAVQAKAIENGIEIVDIVILKVRYSKELQETVFKAMVKERNQQAAAFRSFGQGEKQKLQDQLESDRRAILSGAYKTAEEIKGKADAEAAKIFASALRKDPDFFIFWRTLESYRKTLPKFNKTLTTDLDYFRYLYRQ
jgi:membrane protease subunit HflC